MGLTEVDALNIIWVALAVIAFALGFIGGQQR